MKLKKKMFVLLFNVKFFVFLFSVHATKFLPEDQFLPFIEANELLVECPKVCSENVAVLVAGGQSNLNNSVAGRYVPKGNIIWFNPYNGKCYKYLERKNSSVTTRVAEKLLKQGPYSTVLVANFCVSGTHAELWIPGSFLFQRLKIGLLLLESMKLSPTYFIWELGETDTNFGTPPDEFKKQVKSIFDGIREVGYKGPIYTAKSTRCLVPGNKNLVEISISANKIREAQGDLVDKAKGIFSGPDTDVIQGSGRDSVQCHFSPAGADLAAQLWVDSILGRDAVTH